VLNVFEVTAADLHWLLVDSCLCGSLRSLHLRTQPPAAPVGPDSSATTTAASDSGATGRSASACAATTSSATPQQMQQQHALQLTAVLAAAADLGCLPQLRSLALHVPSDEPARRGAAVDTAAAQPQQQQQQQQQRCVLPLQQGLWGVCRLTRLQHLSLGLLLPAAEAPHAYVPPAAATGACVCTGDAAGDTLAPGGTHTSCSSSGGGGGGGGSGGGDATTSTRVSHPGVLAAWQQLSALQQLRTLAVGLHPTREHAEDSALSHGAEQLLAAVSTAAQLQGEAQQLLPACVCSVVAREAA
jgi:hypothetical protein